MATAVRSDATHDEAIWAIASWVQENVKEIRLSCPNSELPRLADEILAENSSNDRLSELLEAIEGDSEDRAEAMFHSVIYVSRAYCKFSSVFPKDWLDIYKKYVAEAQMSVSGEYLVRDYLDGEFRRIAAYRLVAVK